LLLTSLGVLDRKFEAERDAPTGLFLRQGFRETSVPDADFALASERKARDSGPWPRIEIGICP
jgi:hypothetical protein